MPTMPEMFLDRIEAGRQLAGELRPRVTADTVVLAIPRGGVPVAVEVATRLNLPLDIIVPRKLPIPWNPEAGFGAVTSDGVVVLNEALVRELDLTQDRIREIVQSVSDEIGRRDQVYRSARSKLDIAGKPVVIVDDGLASGYTMIAAVQAARQRGAQRVAVAVPVASESALRLIKESVDDLICLIESHRLPFAVADYYVAWHDLTDEEVLGYLSRVNQHSQTRTTDTRGGA